MTLAAPWALILLVPWLATVVWALLAAQDVAYVPFARMWPTSSAAEANRRKFRRPPWWAVTLLSAALLLICAAADLSTSGGRQICILVDCGLATSPENRVANALLPLQLTGRDVIHIVPVPGEPFMISGTLAGDALKRRLRFTAADTRPEVDRAILATLASQPGQVVVISDDRPVVDDPRLIWLPPVMPLNDAAVEAFTIADFGDTSQAMLRIFNGTAVQRTRLAVGGIDHVIDLPPRGGTKDYFFDLVGPRGIRSAAAAGGDAVISARLELADDIAADNAAFAVVPTGVPVIDVSGDISPAVAKMLDIYRAHRGPANSRLHLDVIAAAPSNDAAFSGPTVWIAPGAATPIDIAAMKIEAHPLTRSIDWPAIAATARGHAPPGPGWRTIVGSSGTGERSATALLAVRTVPSRQVWVGFDIESFSQRSDFVIFWTNVLDWAGDAAVQYADSDPASSAAGQWKPLIQSDPAVIASPGIYERNDGRRVAVSAKAPRQKDRAVAASIAPPANVPRAAVPLTPWLAGAALALLALSLAGVRRLT